jgi:tetratricopeptide (TPR) repeat protein
LRQALDIRRRILGGNHPDYATGLNNLAALYEAMGRYAEAELLSRQALDIHRRFLGGNHPIPLGQMLSKCNSLVQFNVSLPPNEIFYRPPKPLEVLKPFGDEGLPPPELRADYEANAYDEEDHRVLKEVGDYRFGSITARLSNDGIFVLPHPNTEFNEDNFINSIKRSISVSKDEKRRIIMAVPTLSQHQIEQIMIVLDEEAEKFRKISSKQLGELRRLEESHARDWLDLQAEFQEFRRQQFWPTGHDTVQESKTLPPSGDDSISSGPRDSFGRDAST